MSNHYVLCRLNRVQSIRYTIVFFFQAEDGIRDLVRSRGLGDVYKRQAKMLPFALKSFDNLENSATKPAAISVCGPPFPCGCLLYTSDAADERSSVDLGGRRIIKKKNKIK